MPERIGRRRFLREATLVGAAALTVDMAHATAAAQPAEKGSNAAMTTDLSAEDVKALLGLQPHPTCGFVKMTFESGQKLAAGALPAPFADARPLGSALYFMVSPERSVRLHRIRNDQLYHYYLGDSLEVLLLRGYGTSERVIVGPDLKNGNQVQLLIPGNTFHTARLVGGGRWFLGASTEWPGVIPADVEIGNLEELAAKYPAVAQDLRSFAQSPAP